MNSNAIIKSLKERNDRLKNQYEYLMIRTSHLESEMEYIMKNIDDIVTLIQIGKYQIDEVICKHIECLLLDIKQRNHLKKEVFKELTEDGYYMKGVDD